MKFNKNELIGIGLSGGPDSYALLFKLLKLTNQIIIININHQFRLTSTKESNNLLNYCNSLNLTTYSIKIPWNQLPFPSNPSLITTSTSSSSSSSSTSNSIELIARNARLYIFNQILRKHQIKSLYLAHHHTDQTENLLLWGKVMKSSSKLPQSSFFNSKQENFDEIIIHRPLLNYQKSELIEICDQNSLPYFNDPSNLDPTLTPRNALRSELLSAQSRHLLHPNLITSSPTSIISPGGPLALLNKLVTKASSPPSVTPVVDLPSLPQSNTFIHQFSPSLYPPSTSPTLLRSHLKTLLYSVAPHSSSPISQVALELMRERIMNPLNKINRFNPGAGVLLIKSTEHQRKKEGEWTFERQGFRRELGKGRLEITNEWQDWDQRVLVRLRSSTSNLDTRWFIEAGPKRIPTLVQSIKNIDSIFFTLGSQNTTSGIYTSPDQDGTRIEWRQSKK